MPVYSHSQLSTYEECPLRYKLHYRDRIKRDTESVESFRGTMVHETLRKCYEDTRLMKANTLDDLLAYYNKIWRENWHDSIQIVKPDFTQENYRAQGEKMIEAYYERYSPFNLDLTIGTEVRLSFSLDDEGKYRMTGFIDRLSRAQDEVYEIHDYKTSAHLPGQAEADSDRQLALYHIGIQRKWPNIENIRLIWHYLAFDMELISRRSPEAISSLVQDTRGLIDEIESARDFPPRESALCGWCEYPDLCPLRKHFFKVEPLPVNEYLEEPGVVLVNKYVALRDEGRGIAQELEKVKEAIFDYARREEVELIKGSGYKARVKFGERLKFPGKNDAGRPELDGIIKKAGKWEQVSQLDSTALASVVEGSQWSKELMEEVMKHGKMEKSSSVSVSRLKDEECVS